VINLYPNLKNMPRRKNKDLPQKGGIVRCQNGMIGEILRTNVGRWGDSIEIDVDGTRCYVDLEDVEVINVLERIAREL
jgi:hypothetical protein